MKKLLFLFAAVTVSVSLYAQTTVVDPSNSNGGTLNPGPSLLFGSPTGEGIASRRNGGGNQYGLDFYTNHTNRMVITNGGRVGIGITTPQQQLSIGAGLNIDQLNQNPGSYLVGALTFGSASGEGIGSNRTTVINRYGLDFYTGGLPRVFITNTGNVGIGNSNPTVKLQVAGAIMSSGGVLPSDIRYKKNILPITGALNTVMSLSGFTYLLKKEDFPEMGFDSKLQYGLLAQNVESVIPEIVCTDQNGYKALDYTRIIPFLVEGMKEQQKTIEKQQQQIDELKKMVEALIKK